MFSILQKISDLLGPFATCMDPANISKVKLHTLSTWLSPNSPFRLMFVQQSSSSRDSVHLWFLHVLLLLLLVCEETQKFILEFRPKKFLKWWLFKPRFFGPFGWGQLNSTQLAETLQSKFSFLLQHSSSSKSKFSLMQTSCTNFDPSFFAIRTFA